MSVSGPLWVLQPATVSALAVLLDQEKLLATAEGRLRDWRGVAELSVQPCSGAGHTSLLEDT